MFEKQVHYCPECNWQFQEQLADGMELRCPHCSAEFRALVDEATGRASLLRIEEEDVPEPLHLPRGSIRALVAMSLAASCWILVGQARALPESLLSLLLTVLGYYFGFRRNAKAAQSNLADASRKVSDPLHLPGGSIRLILATGFGISAVALGVQGRLGHGPVLAFFLILAGLLVGHVYGRITANDRTSGTVILISHVKALAVLVTTAGLTAAYLAGWAAHWPSWSIGLLSAIVSFYFGSR
jgi:DNA-directed RNA polymerase subunit RPC12/RpoP